jgi:hypothetical protein
VVVASADFQTAIVEAWNGSTLNDSFAALGGESPLLWEGIAPPGQPFPYCVMEVADNSRVVRMSASSGTREVRHVTHKFSVLAKEVVGDSRTAKEIAAYLAEEVMKVFGGHPTQAPSEITLDNGNLVTADFENDFGIKIDEEIYQWDVNYIFMVDVPVAG